MITETIHIVLRRGPLADVLGLATFAVELSHAQGKLMASVHLVAVDGQPASGPEALSLSNEDYEMACHVVELRARERLVYLPIDG